MSILSDIIDGASGESVSTGTLLRKALVVATRLESPDLRSWAESELKGYDRKSPGQLPPYRGPFAVQANGLFVNEYGTVQTRHQISANTVANAEIRAHLFDIHFFQPITELEDLANAPLEGGATPTMAWDQSKVGIWNSLIGAGEVPRPGDTFLFAAHQQIPQSFLRGIVDHVRTTLLTIMLDLEGADPSTGSIEGPTISNPAIANAVHSNIFQINNYGSNNSVKLDSANMATGDARVIRGDVRSLTSAAAEYLSEEGLAELEAAASAAPKDRGTLLHSFLRRLEEGAVKVASNVGTSVASQHLTGLIGQFLAGG